MDHREQISAFEHELRAVIARFIKEYDLTLADAIGTIEVVKLRLYHEQTEENSDD